MGRGAVTRVCGSVEGPKLVWLESAKEGESHGGTSFQI